MILILILSNNIRNDSHSRPERSPEHGRVRSSTVPRQWAGRFVLPIYGSLLRSPGGPVPVTAPNGQTGRRCGTVCQSAKCPNIGHGPYRYALERVPLGSQRQHSRPGVTQSHLKLCPPLTFWAFRPSRPESANSLPTAWQPSYGPSPSLIGSLLISGAKCSSYALRVILRHPLDGV